MFRNARSTRERALQASTARSAPMSSASRPVRTTQAVEPGFRGDSAPIARPGHAVLANLDVEVLLHLPAVGPAPRRLGGAVPAGRPGLSARGGGRDLPEGLLRGREQLLAPARPLLAKARVGADHKPLSGELRARDLGHRVGNQALRGERSLAASLRPQQLSDVGGLRGRDPVEIGRTEVLADARRRGHAAVADQRDAGDAEARTHLGGPGRQGGRVARVAGEHLHRRGAAAGGAQKPAGGLLLAFLAVAVVAEGGERAASPLEVARARVVENRRAVALQVAVGQAALDPGLATAQPARHPGTSLPSTGPRPRTGPRLEDAVSGDSVRAQASLEPGSTGRAATAATARLRMREASRPRIRATPSDLNVPGIAATWPCGSDLRTAAASSSDGSTTPPLSAARTASTSSGGILERFASVRLLMRVPSRQASRRRIAGRELLFGMMSTPGAAAESCMATFSNRL